MALDGCGLFCKYILIIFNIIFAVVGFAFLGLGLWLRFSDNTRAIFHVEELSSSAFVMGVTVLIALGAVMLFVVMFGDYGACNEKRCALQVFSALLAILATLVVVVGVLVNIKSNEVGLRFAEFYASLYTIYVANQDPGIAVTLTFIHNTLHCCGLTGVSIIELVKQTCPEPDGFFEHIKMDSCPGVIADVFIGKAPMMMGTFVGTGVLLFIALICSITLSRKIVSASTPQYIILTQTTSTQANFLPAQHEVVTSTRADQEPVFFTPLSAANIPVAYA
ncbi:CD81 antigen isoform X1 [Astatotilapia calliptera]|uniref:Tetraspanin n=1 Tax=Astatotilapia calliptera TaxID=8154 RepID=A0A3P8Q8S4_ASTCA|nr:CD81 antigen-like isoform X1 [Astatotilapia calliptera]XP_026021504.1 CD81 antigen-like isoform X1 [Astatotilapia calliptera]